MRLAQTKEHVPQPPARGLMLPGVPSDRPALEWRVTETRGLRSRRRDKCPGALVGGCEPFGFGCQGGYELGPLRGLARGAQNTSGECGLDVGTSPDREHFCTISIRR